MGFAAVAVVSAVLATIPAAADAASPPTIESESVTNITSTDATIETQINTGGRETTYRVWVGNYPECIEEMMEECESSAKHPIDGILAGSSSPTRISVDVAKAWHALSPGSSYIYHVSATNSDWAFEGSAYGENKVFKTATASPPAIESESVSHLTSTDATLEAQINTEGLETDYEFHLVGFPCRLCEMGPIETFSLPAGGLLGSFVGQSVSLDLNSAGVKLSPGEEYNYWLTATSAAGHVESRYQTFTAPEDGVQPLSTNTTPGMQSGAGTVPPVVTEGNVTSSPSTAVLTNTHRLRATKQSHTLVAYTEQQGGVVFRYTSLIVSTRGRATVRYERCMRRFHLDATLWKRLKAALKRTNLHALSGNRVPAVPRAEESTWVIVVGRDTVRITAFSIPAELRVKMEPLLKVLGQVVSVGKRDMPQSCGSKRVVGGAG